MDKTSKKDLIVGDRTIHTTTDYAQFKTMSGNRNVNKAHVRELQRLLVDNGNLTNQFPIVVNKEMEVIDGQHRLEALRELGWEIAYIVEDGATINMVRAINLGNKNWNWRDLGQSYSNLGNKEYAWFLRFIESQNISFTLAIRFCGVKGTQGSYSANSDYNQGYLYIPEKTKAVETAEHYNAVIRELEDGMASREFGYAIHKLKQSAQYDPERMIQKIKEKGHTLPRRATTPDYLRLLEELYNDKVHEENRVRLF